MRSLFGIVFIALSASCSRTSHTTDTPQPQANVTVSQPQKVEIETQVLASLTQSYERLSGSNSALNPGWALQAAHMHLNKIKGIVVTQCNLQSVGTATVQKCLFIEVLSQNQIKYGLDLTSETLALIDSLAAQLTSLSKEIVLLNGQQAKVNMPYLAKSFFEGKKFVLTTSLQQGSVGTSRVYNLEALSVSLLVNSNRLVILQNKAGQFSSTDAIDSIVTSYPIVDTKSDGNETYFQIDFSHPANLKMYRNALGDGDPSLDITADVVIPTIAHAEKVLNPALNSTQYFNGGNSQLVLDSLVLVTGSFQPTSTDQSLFKDALHPTMRVVQGLMAESAKNKSFAASQALELTAASDAHLEANTKDLTGGQDVAFFATNPFLANAANGNVVQKAMVKKFDASEDILFVLSANTPTSAIPVLKSALESYNGLFAAFKNETATKILALSSDEYASFVKASGADLPEFPIAADPRVNMISWSSDDSLGAAWATTIADPFSGRVISGDVMMSGNLWARVGCTSYLAKAWAMKAVKGEKLSSLLVPDDVSKSWPAQCAETLKTLGIGQANAIGPTNDDAQLANAQLTNTQLTDTAADFSSNLSDSSDAILLPARYQTALVKSSSDDINAVIHAPTMAKTDATVTLSLGKNVLRLKPGCMRDPNSALTEATQFGLPGVNLALIKEPSQGALAMVRAIAMHELGHLFGMRHNFAGSLTTAKLTSTSPIPLMTDSDSYMDYNDYGVEMSAGAMSDYTSSMGATSTATFGAYDALALGKIYNLNTSGLVFAEKPSFCSDVNVKRINGFTFGDCQPNDYGPDGITFALQQLNQDLMALKAAGLPLDASAGGRIRTRLFANIQGLTLALFDVQEKLSLRHLKAEQKEALLSKIAAITKGESMAPLLTKWSTFTGQKLSGLFDALKPQASEFQNEILFFRTYDALIAQKIANQSFIDSLANLANYRRSQTGDEKYISLFRDLTNFSDANWKTKFIEQYAAEVILPKGTNVEYTYLLDGQDVNGNQAKFKGEPVVFTLDEPMLNHLKLKTVKKLMVTGADGQDQEVVATAKGKYTIGELKQLAAALSVMDIYGTSASARILEHKKTLECLAGQTIESCPTTIILTDISLVAAKTLAKTYQRLYDFLQDPDREVVSRP